MTFTRLAWCSCLVLVACGGKSREVCPSEKHLADPDGRGERCIDDGSTCDAPSECTSNDACCTPACGDASGSGVYACTEQCRVPDCTEGSCGDGWRCQEAPNDGCSAYCVPVEVQCEAGTIPADPTGTGNFLCVPVESTCLRPADCPGSVDGCCAGVCAEQAGGAWACEEDCATSEADQEPGGGAAMWECGTDLECEEMMGGPGWTCEHQACGGNVCVAPVAECDGDEDCALAIDVSACCASCESAYSLAELAQNECLVAGLGGDAEPQGDSEGAPPEDPPVCECLADIACPAIDCIAPTRAGCSSGQCVPLYE